MLDRYDIQMKDLPPDYREIAEAIGLDTALTLVAIRGGEGIYVPKAEKIARKARNRVICAQFTGANHRELARRHRLSVVQIRNILAAGTNASAPTGVNANDEQLPLF